MEIEKKIAKNLKGISQKSKLDIAKSAKYVKIQDPKRATFTGFGNYGRSGKASRYIDLKKRDIRKVNVRWSSKKRGSKAQNKSYNIVSNRSYFKYRRK